MWVEADLNLSGGESLCRQLLHGQKSFEKWFGVRSDTAFLPDDFGYPGSLPQIVAEGGCNVLLHTEVVVERALILVN